ncbi:unnamed protein product [Staurois parvus]|uniref:Uncharacterized protein n=1 Tax=Staurois parvus TaxID=386267 RepID=A0ABN9BV49_9NEOB|nr:unnamed protein product [Staurois parvus]
MRREYTGALCGLGWHYRNLAVWPEHDIELAFDVRFTAEDLFKINMIRSAINRLVCYSYGGSINNERTRRLQEDVREQLLSLFQKEKHREMIHVKCFENMYQWNQVETRYLVGQSGSAEEEENNSHIYQLHKFILLNS